MNVTKPGRLGRSDTLVMSCLRNPGSPCSTRQWTLGGVTGQVPTGEKAHGSTCLVTPFFVHGPQLCGRLQLCHRFKRHCGSLDGRLDSWSLDISRLWPWS